MKMVAIDWSRYGRVVVLAGALLGSAEASAQAPLSKARTAASHNAGAQTTYDTQKNLTVAVTKFAETRAALTGFIRQRAVRVQKQEETPEQLIAEFALRSKDLLRLDSLTAGLGNMLESNLNTYDLSSHMAELRADELRLTTQVATLQQKLEAEKLGPEDRDRVRLDAERAANRLAEARQELAVIAARTGQAYVTVRLFDEVSFPTGNRRVSFVNMPGVEYAYLRLDNPKVGLTSTAYQGYALKYLVTRGKSYLNLGVYKPVERNAASEDFINELFVINFGQDFYPRNFGRGRRRFLNLYTSYQLGGFIVNRNSDKGNEFIPNLNLGLGVEVLKTRHVLFDVKTSYFVPLNERSRDLRGLLGQAAFNFVF